MQNPNGIVQGNNQNIPEAQVPRTRSTFPLHYHFFNSHRFGEYIPHFVMDAVKDDKLPIHSSHELRSYTLKSPMMQNVTRNKDYFFVPMESILPLNWEKFFDNPVRGDDVLDDVGPSVEDFWSKVSTLMNAFVNAMVDSTNGILYSTQFSLAQRLIATFRFIILGEYFYSNGNLLSSTGCHGSPYCLVQDSQSNVKTWDDFFDEVISIISAGFTGGDYLPLYIDGFLYRVNLDGRSTSNNHNYISLRHALQLMRDNPTFDFGNVVITGWSSFTTDMRNLFGASGWNLTFRNAAVPCDLSSLWAYQLCCSHFYSNDHVDYVYSAELFRQLIGNYLIANVNMSNYSFLRNGITYQYDYLSAKGFAVMIANSIAYPAQLLTTRTDGGSLGQLGYYSALFGFRRSLRYLDYFTGSRTQPLAVAGTGVYNNTNVPVSGGQVSVIDITRSIQAQRFLNAVNRVRHNFEGYLKGIFGGELPAPDYHNPFFLAHTDDVVFGQETENTGAAQVSTSVPIAITTNLRSNAGKYMFEYDCDRPAIVIGITNYDIPRVYQRSMERRFLRLNRFDWFNPFTQYTGDQPIYLQEVGINHSSLNAMNNFAYALHNMEYKQRFHQAAGAFCVPSTDLDLWIFTAQDNRGDQHVLNPDWIRSLNVEFDRFYNSLSGWSLGTYFHFIVDDYNSCDASRPMAYAPSIL